MSTLSNIETGDVTAGMHLSCWTETYIQPDSFKQPEKEEKTDVLIVGCGITGASIAYQLLKRGKRVIIADDGYPGSGETGRTSAHLTYALDIRYHELINRFGKEKASLILNSHKDAIDQIERISREENIDCEFQRVTGFLFLHPDDEEESLKKEAAALQELHANAEYISELTSVKNYSGPAIQFNDQAIFHPLKYLGGLVRCIEQMGGIIYTGTKITEINDDHVITEKGIKLTSEQVVVATNSPVNNKFALNASQFPYRSYIIGALVQKDCMPFNLWWDTGEVKGKSTFSPYHYVRLEKYDDQHDLLIAGGEDHPTGLPEEEKIPEEKRYKNLEAWCRRHFPVTEIIYWWSGQVVYPADSIANIGRNPLDSNNVYVSSGDCGNGLTYGTIASMIIPDLILGIENPYIDLYKPNRKGVRQFFTFLKEFTGGLIEYLKNKPEEKESGKITQMQPGDAEIVNIEGDKYAVYKDFDNEIHMVSAECTHLGCIIKWNNDERSWDCPCHGSRFTFTGQVINGPANKDLEYRKSEIK